MNVLRLETVLVLVLISIGGASFGHADNKTTDDNLIKINDPGYWYNHSHMLFELGLQSESEKAYYKAIELDPNRTAINKSDPVYWFHEGDPYEIGNTLGKKVPTSIDQYLDWSNESIKCLSKALELDPSPNFAQKIYYSIVYLYAILDEMQSQCDSKSDSNEYGFNKTIKNKITATLNYMVYGKKLFDKLLEANPSIVNVWQEKGGYLFGQGNYSEAIDCYTKAIELDPTYSDNWRDKGRALEAMGEHDEAIVAYERAITLDPYSVLPWIYKGVALDKQGKFDEAITAYDEAIRLNRNYTEAWYNKGIALEALGRTAEANVAFAMAKEKEPASPVRTGATDTSIDKSKPTTQETASTSDASNVVNTQKTCPSDFDAGYSISNVMMQSGYFKTVNFHIYDEWIELTVEPTNAGYVSNQDMISCLIGSVEASQDVDPCLKDRTKYVSVRIKGPEYTTLLRYPYSSALDQTERNTMVTSKEQN